jgi:hypothetical protein
MPPQPQRLPTVPAVRNYLGMNIRSRPKPAICSRIVFVHPTGFRVRSGPTKPQRETRRRLGHQPDELAVEAADVLSGVRRQMRNDHDQIDLEAIAPRLIAAALR